MIRRSILCFFDWISLELLAVFHLSLELAVLYESLLYHMCPKFYSTLANSLML